MGPTLREPLRRMNIVRRKVSQRFWDLRGPLITTGTGVPVDFAMETSADIDDREVVPLLCQRGAYPILLGDKGYISGPLIDELLETENTC